MRAYEIGGGVLRRQPCHHKQIAVFRKRTQSGAAAMVGIDIDRHGRRDFLERCLGLSARRLCQRINSYAHASQSTRETIVRRRDIACRRYRQFPAKLARQQGDGDPLQAGQTPDYGRDAG